jgi:hypothetical protein
LEKEENFMHGLHKATSLIMVKRTNIARNVYLFSSFSDRGGLQVDLEGQRTQPRDYIVLSLM